MRSTNIPGQNRADTFFMFLLAVSVCLLVYIQYLWLQRPPLSGTSIGSSLKLQDMKENMRLAIKGYNQGYLRTVSGYGLFAIFALNFVFLGKMIFNLIWKKEPSMSFPEKVAAYYISGSLGYSLIWLLLGSLGFISLQTGIFLIFAGLTLAAMSLNRAGTRLSLKPMYIGFRSFSLDEKVLSVGLILILAAISTLSVMDQIYSDSYQIHLPLPWSYIQWGKIVPNPYSVYSYFPQNTEMLMVWPLLFRSEVASVLVLWGFLVSVILMVWGFFYRITSNWVGISAAYMALASTSIVWYGMTIKNDLPAAAFILLHYLTLINSLTLRDSDFEASKKWAIISGVLCGGAIGHKLTALIPALWTFLFLFGLDIKEKNATVKNSLALRWTIGVIASSAPWFIKAFWETGNPVYPYLNQLFGRALLKPWHTVAQISVSAAGEGWPALKDYFANIIGLSRQNGIILPAGWGVSALFFLLFFPLMTKPLAKNVKWIMFAAFLSYVSLASYAFEFRYHLGPFMFLVTYSFAYFMQTAKDLKPIKYAVYALIFGSIFQNYNNSLTFSSLKQSVSQLISGHSPGNFSMARLDQQLQDLRWMGHLINTRTPKNESVLFAGVTYGYGIDRRFFFGVDPDKQILQDLAERSNDSADLYRQLDGMGVNHILFYTPFNVIYKSKSRPELKLKDEDAQKIVHLLAQQAVLRYTTPDGMMQWFTLKKGEQFSPLEINESDILFSPASTLEILNQLWKQREFAAAQRIAEKAVTVPMHSSNKALVYGILGVLQSAKGDIVGGEDFLLKGVQIAPDNVSALVNLALFYKNHNLHPDRVQNLVRKIMDLGGENVLRRYPGVLK